LMRLHVLCSEVSSTGRKCGGGLVLKRCP